MKHLTVLLLLLGGFCFGQNSYKWDGETLTYNGMDYSPRGLAVFNTGTIRVATQADPNYSGPDNAVLHDHQWFGFNTTSGVGDRTVTTWTDFTGYDQMVWNTSVTGNTLTTKRGLSVSSNVDVPTGDVEIFVTTSDDDCCQYAPVNALRISYTNPGSSVFFTHGVTTDRGHLVTIRIVRNLNSISVQLSGDRFRQAINWRWAITPNGGTAGSEVTGQTYDQFVAVLNTLSGGDMITFNADIGTTEATQVVNAFGQTVTIPASIRN